MKHFAYVTPPATHVTLTPQSWTGFLDALTVMHNSVAPNRYLTSTYVISGQEICFKFSDDRLLKRFGRAIAHLETPSTGHSDLTVFVCDGKTSTLPRIPWAATDVSYRGDVQVRGLGSRDWVLSHRLGEKIVTALNKKTRIAYAWTEDIETVPNWATAAPLRALLHQHLQDVGCQLVHGAALASNGQALMLSARGGSGKSTTAMRCLLAGMDYLGDDYVGVTFRGKTPVVTNLYNTGKLHRHEVERMANLPTDSELADEDIDAKEIFYLTETAFAGSIITEAALAAVMVPVICGHKKTTLRPLSPTQALAALAPTTMTQLPTCGNAALLLMRKLVEAVPCYVLELGSDGENIPGFLTEILSRGQVFGE